jgi:LuxR family transcriptional regulator, maltose regulon positive regulatory protein
MSKRDIARTLFLSPNTINSHTKTVYRKLGASSRSEAVQRARQTGLL